MYLFEHITVTKQYHHVGLIAAKRTLTGWTAAIILLQNNKCTLVKRCYYTQSIYQDTLIICNNDSALTCGQYTQGMRDSHQSVVSWLVYCPVKGKDSRSYICRSIIILSGTLHWQWLH